MTALESPAPMRWRRSLAGMVLLSGAINLLTLVPTLYMLQVFDRVMVGNNLMTLLLVSALALYLWALLAVGEWLRSQWSAVLGMRWDAAVSPRLFEAGFRGEAGAATGASRPLQDVATVRNFLTGHVLTAFLDAPFAVVFLGALFFLHPLLGWVALGLFVVQAVLAGLAQRAVRSVSRRARVSAEAVQGLGDAVWAQAEAAQAMGMVRGMQARWRALHVQSQRLGEQSAAAGSAVADLSKFLRYVQQGVSLAAGAWLAVGGEITAASMIAANVFMSRALAPVDQITGAWTSLEAVGAAWQRVNEALARLTPGSVPALFLPVGAGVLAPELEIAHLSIGRTGSAPPLLQDLRFVLPPGTLTVLLGPSGSGKSSLARALVGAVAVGPVSGSVTVNGRARPLSGPVLPHPQMGYLPQSVGLLEGSVADNISRMGAVDADAVVEAAKLADLHDMILALPQGYDTPVGEGGRHLSGGLRQRIGLARALYGDPWLLVLDEPDAQLDQAGELALRRAIDRELAEGKTVLLISHRRHWVERADRLLVLSQGVLQAAGPREGVLAAWRESQSSKA